MILLANISFVNAQQTTSLLDSIKKYQFLNPNLAIKYGTEYVEIRAGDEPDIEMVRTYGRIGEVLLYMELYSSALEYFNSALRIRSAFAEKRGKKLRQDSPWIVLNIGNIYFKNKNYEKALEKFKEARALFDMAIRPQNRLNGLNTSNSNIGLVYGARGEYEKQEQIYYKVYDNRISNPSKDVNYSSTILYSMAQILSVKLLKDDLISAENKLNEIIEFYEDQKIKISDLPNSLLTRNYGYVFSIMGAYYQSKKQYGKAIKNLEKAIVIFKSFPVEINVTRSRLSECYLAIDEIDIAEEIALENLNFKNLSDREKRYNFRVLEKIYKKTKKDQKLIRIKDSLILISSGSNSSKIIKSLNDLETQILLSNSARELNESKIRYNTYLYVLIIGSVILFFSLITIRINYNYQKEKGTRLELEKDKVTQELNQKNRELVSKANFIIQRNDYLKNIQKKISSPQKTEDYSSKMLVNELNRVINSEKSYDEFDRMFINVYPNFYNKLNQINKLSQTDLRLASYIKMNHNNNEIANISGISLRTVESQRYRLTKKLNLDKNQDLNSFLMTM
ncbi:MAG: tetratricopeptide repeat protein [Flavobacteriaceae bacterium]|nr:tetratricopeptide repeat protein [Flavobacteriaceae bacterium]